MFLAAASGSVSACTACAGPIVSVVPDDVSIVPAHMYSKHACNEKQVILSFLLFQVFSFLSLCVVIFESRDKALSLPDMLHEGLPESSHHSCQTLTSHHAVNHQPLMSSGLGPEQSPRTLCARYALFHHNLFSATWCKGCPPLISSRTWGHALLSPAVHGGMPSSHLPYMGACPLLTSQDADDDRPQEGDRCNCAAGWGGGGRASEHADCRHANG